MDIGKEQSSILSLRLVYASRDFKKSQILSKSCGSTGRKLNSGPPSTKQTESLTLTSLHCKRYGSLQEISR